ncbi:MAG: hypothetical protein ACRDT6_25975 [Micromonosporaceae bacterium]
MEYWEFSELTQATIRGTYDRIHARYHDGFEGLFVGGELRLAVEELLGGLVRFNTPITPAERDDLARILAYLKEPASKLDRLNVTTPR